MRIHDGAELCLDGWELLPTEGIADQWRTWRETMAAMRELGVLTSEPGGLASEPDPGIRSDWWNVGWIPLASDGAGDSLCVDLAPAPGGRKGQLITMIHDDSPRPLVAGSFHEWLSALADGMESGAYVFSEYDEGVVRAEDA
jgi:cell wall assembly regulator SMI1